MNNPLQGTVKLPGIKKPVKKVYVVAGVAVTAAILAYAYYRRANAPAETAPVEATGDEYAADADTGVYAPYGTTIGGDPIAAPINPGTGGTGGGTTSTNAQWTTEAVALLTQTGVTEDVAATAVASVLGGLGVTSAQEAMFLRAVGTLGNPPQGYPRPIRLISTPQDPAPAPQDPAPHDPAPQAPAPQAPAPAAPAAPTTPAGAGKKTPGKVTGLKASDKGQTYVDLDWTPVKDAAGYIVYRGGDRVTTVVYSNARVSGLKKNTSYSLSVQAMNGALTGPKATINVRTTNPQTVSASASSGSSSKKK